MKRLRLIPVLSISCVCSLFQASGGYTDTIYLDDSDPDTIRLGNASYYEMGLLKSNGSIAYIIDKSTRQAVTLGSRYECLWGVVFPEAPTDYVGGCSYNVNGPNSFTYSWSADTSTLTLNYDPDSSSTRQVTAQVTITASKGPYFDIRLHIQNNWGHTLEYVLLPSDLVFLEADIQKVILPILPGVELDSSFFHDRRSYTVRYPGYPGMFADYVFLNLNGGTIAIYTLYEPGPVPLANLGFIHDDEYVPLSTFYSHVFHTLLVDGGDWISPPIRVRISQPLIETIVAYRTDNKLYQFPSLAGKAGPHYDVLVKAPLIKADAVQTGHPFTAYGGLLAQLPSPSLLHPVAFQPGGHDENYPDFLPPDPAWGTTEDFRTMFDQAHALGLLVMPYTNPTWWDDNSSTLQNLPPPLSIHDIAVLNADGVPVYEYYGPRGGYVMSPYPSLVTQRLAQLMYEMTIDLPSDVLFEDQIGARPWLYDFNPSSPSPTAYIEGWLEHTRTYSDILLMTELGFDRLAESEIGFHGSLLLPERLGYTSDWWGTGNWHPYPLAPLMIRDRIFFYQHDLAPETMTADKATLMWNMAFGYMLSYDISTGGLENAWLDVVGTFQKQVISRYAGETMTNFIYLSDGITQTAFETFTVLTNWDESDSYDVGLHTLPPQGFLATSNDGCLTAGILTVYNGDILSPGDHYLAIDSYMDSIVVWHPKGPDTKLKMDRPGDWIDASAIHVHSVGQDTAMEVSKTVTDSHIVFYWNRIVSGVRIRYYALSYGITGGITVTSPNGGEQ